jgi:glycosyltransferase involved in cell wall biosynthesis
MKSEKAASRGIKISGIIVTYNEEGNIGRCLESIKDVADEIVVVDSFSTDNTEKICRDYGVKFVQKEYVTHIEQKQFAASLVEHDYILMLDADECLSDELVDAIREIKKSPEADGYVINRFNKYCDRWIRHSGYYPDKKVRLWNRHKASIEGTNPHEKVVMHPGTTVKRLDLDILHYAYDSVDEHLKQMYNYSIIVAQAKFKKGEKANFVLHVLLNPVFKFIKTYIFQLGFLDGYYGLVFCMAGSSLNFFKYLRLYEYNRLKKKNLKLPF